MCFVICTEKSLCSDRRRDDVTRMGLVRSSYFATPRKGVDGKMWVARCVPAMRASCGLLVTVVAFQVTLLFAKPAGATGQALDLIRTAKSAGQLDQAELEQTLNQVTSE